MKHVVRALGPLAFSCAAILAACSSDDGGGGATSDTDGGGTTIAPDGAVVAPDGAKVETDGGGPATPIASSGCGKALTGAEATWVKRDITVGGAARQVYVRAPAGYDPDKKYPVVYQLHGCSSSEQRETNVVPIEKSSGNDAILVRGRAAANCWDTKDDGPDVAYFDAMLDDVEKAFCVDEGRRFVTGYSSGSFLTHKLACIRGDKLRGVATIAGGQGGTNCKGSVAALLIHDANDKTVNISQSEAARDAHLSRNGCDSPPKSSPGKTAPCVEYAGCDAGKSVVWCPTTGKDHDRQDNLAHPIFWSFLSGLR